MTESLSRPASLPPLQQVTPQWLFNRLQTQGGLTLVDTRGFKCYEHSHIWSFMNLPQPLVTSTSMVTVITNAGASPSPLFLSSVDDVCPLTDTARRSWNKRKLTDVVLYDHFGMYTPSSWPMQLAVLLLHERAVTSVKFLRGGMQAFQRDYPFMITGRKDPHPVSPLSTPVKTTVAVDSLPRNIHTHHGHSSTTTHHALTFPNDVVPGFLYLGNVWQASQPEVLRKMGITHVMSICENGPSHPMPRITYMNVPPASLHDAFDGVYAFLKKARKAGGKVLINCVSGVSASPTLAVYYLMRSERISLVQAYNDVLACRPLMFPSVTCMLMLVEAELYRCGVASIQSKEAMDALQDGSLRDDTPCHSQMKLSAQLSMFFLGRCNDRYVRDNMHQYFGDSARRSTSLVR
ncbi:hypothetical protein DYB26_005327 [Aphanomyces astaci]|uniref:protein-tyrosine-phosphatase n=2 Tax=Aphanomyces astaci TaxID=112090 RepID=A0A397F6R2_APHAT|nr:hypothetical protein DYB36_008111 [Aphanomyces astaci]RHY43889.1 hypothetical protein DYB34_007853 [Aphanomyces astaci]RHZ17488.1 hypothetical protein DYB31_008199 [Aphanomyces astaci]RHZ29032.1 hypothetical protein DYB26_005327 [Aphanomyces astaci]